MADDTNGTPCDTGLNTKNPYGPGEAKGISLPGYFRPTCSILNSKSGVSKSDYFPGTETLERNEMRISFVGSCPWPPRLDQAGTSIMVELGNGRRYFFDFGPGCLRNIVAMQIPHTEIDNIFLSHLHVDHYGAIPYLLPFRAMSGGYKPLNVIGPSGRGERDGTKHMIKHMKEMLSWHLDSFDMFPIGDGYDVCVHEFDFMDRPESPVQDGKLEGGVCYQDDEAGVTVRHWPRSHTKDGASAYRLDWQCETGENLSFVWTGDGRPDCLTAEYARGCDVFVTEMNGFDLATLLERKVGMPPAMYDYMIDTFHTTQFAVGKLMAEVAPRLGMVTHFWNDESLIPELVAGVRTHWNGLFQLGVDVAVVNVSPDAIWYRKAALPRNAWEGRPKDPAKCYPKPRTKRECMQGRFVRDMEIDYDAYTPEDVRRPLQFDWRPEWLEPKDLPVPPAFVDKKIEPELTCPATEPIPDDKGEPFDPPEPTCI